MKKNQICLLAASLMIGALSLHNPMALRAEEAKAAATTPAAAEAAPVAKPLPDSAELVKINGKTITVEQMKALVMLRGDRTDPVDPEKDVPVLRGERLEKIARQVGGTELLAGRAKENGLTLEEREQANVESTVARWNDSQLYKLVVADKVKEPTKEELDALYEEQKESQFRQKEELKMRHVFVSTYVDHTVAAGETLESIAKNVGGDASLADKILDDATKRPRAEKKEVASPDGTKKEELDPAPLQEGEKLKVPVQGEKESAARGKIDAAYARLEKGDAFLEVAKEMSENENPGQLWVIRPEDQERPVMPELKEAFMGLQDGKFSKPLRTKHGFQIVLRESYTPKGYVEREKAEPTLKQIADRRQREKLVDDFFNDRVNDASLVVLNEEILKVVSEEGKDKEPIITVGEKKFSLSELSAEAQQAIKDAKGDLKAVRAALPKQRALQGELVKAYAKQLKLDESPIVQFVKETQTDSILASKYLNSAADEQLAIIPPADLEAYYEKNKEQFRQKESFTLFKIVKPHGDGEEAAKKAAEELAQAVAGVQSLEEFKEKADSVNPKEDKRFAKGGSLGRLNAERLPEAEINAIRKVTAPGKTEVYDTGSEAAVVWVNDSTKDYLPTLEEKKSDIESIVKRQKRGELTNTLLEDARKTVPIEILAKD